MGTLSCSVSHCRLEPGRRLFDYADEMAVRIPTSCGRSARCHECIVEVTRGADMLAPRTPAEDFLRGNFRLACQAVIGWTGADVEFAPVQRQPQILTHTPDTRVELDPMVTRSGTRVDYDGRPVDRYRGRIFGVAVDVGTTTMVADLVDLETGLTAARASFENPQRFGGSDVINRISYDGGPYHGELHRSVVRALNNHLAEMYRHLDIERQSVYEVVIVGNATMRDIFFNVPVESIGQKPYRSRLEHDYRAGVRGSTSIVAFARSLGVLTHPNARVFGAPLIASHVGADTAADLLAIDAVGHRNTFMLVDIGTNTEVVVGHQGRLVTASCPAGPAFEGGLIKYGMTAADGAIETLRWRDGRWAFGTIGGGRPQGICGSGLIDVLSELRRHDLMTPKGVFANKARELMLVPEEGITFSRDDMSQLAQAKAANYCGQFIAMRAAGVRPADIDHLYLAGGFANYIDVRNAIEIGFLAPVDEARVVKVGNASLAGARQMLLSKAKRRCIEDLVTRIEHLELETTPDFFDIFVEGCQFKPMPGRSTV